MSLAIVVPAHDRADTIGPLVRELLALPVVSELVVVDDASTDETAAVAALSALGDPRFRLIRQETNAGAGAARNRGFAEVSAPYVLFLDADDHVVPETIVSGVAHLDRFGGDFLLFRYAIFDRDPRQLTAMNAPDVAIWQREMKERALVSFTREEGAGFMGLVNFPWTRIHRTEVARAYGLSFSHTRVHNDVHAHWQSFLESERFLAFNQIGVLHRISRSAHHLNNRMGRERFDIFTTFEEVDRLFAARLDRERFHPLYLLFRITVLGWIHANIAPELVPEFQARVARAFADFDADAYARCRRTYDRVADLCVNAKLAPAALWPARAAAPQGLPT